MDYDKEKQKEYYDKSKEELLDLARNNDMYAAYQLARNEFTCHTDEEPEFVEYWFTEAALNGHVDAMFDLGLYYYDSYQEYRGIIWFIKAYESGCNDAIHYLALCYDKGYGVIKNKEKALYYYKEEAKTNSDANSYLEEAYNDSESSLYLDSETKKYLDSLKMIKYNSLYFASDKNKLIERVNQDFEGYEVAARTILEQDYIYLGILNYAVNSNNDLGLDDLTLALYKAYLEPDKEFLYVIENIECLNVTKDNWNKMLPDVVEMLDRTSNGVSVKEYPIEHMSDELKEIFKDYLPLRIPTNLKLLATTTKIDEVDPYLLRRFYAVKVD